MNKFLPLLLLLPWVSYSQTQRVFTFEHDGLEREFEVYVPANYEAGEATPLVLNLHGLGSDREQQQFYAQMDRIADTAGFIIAYPQGTEIDFQGIRQRHWNARVGTGVDDLGFLSALVDTVSHYYNIDLERVYSCGMSNGGYMSLYLACERADLFTAVASVTGSMTQLLLNTCDPSERIPMMQIHGTRDLVVPFNGPPSIDEVVDFWVEHNTCGSSPEIISIPDTDMTDNCTAEKRVYQDCEDDVEVWYYVVDNGGHTWPGTFPIPPLGNTCNDFFASEEIWHFFRKFPKQTTSTHREHVAEIQVIPNPSSGYIELKNIDDRTITVTHTSGARYHIQAYNGRFDIRNLQTGMYFFSTQSQTGKFVKI